MEDQAGVEVIGRQRRQVVEFGAVVLPDRVRMAGDPAGVVVDFPDTDLVVEFVQARRESRWPWLISFGNAWVRLQADLDLTEARRVRRDAVGDKPVSGKHC